MPTHFFLSVFFPCLPFLPCSILTFFIFSPIPMCCGNLDDKSDVARLQAYGIVDLNSEDENFGNYAADTQMSRPPLRPRHPIDFYPSALQYPSSHTSESTLHSNPNFLLPLHKAACKTSSLGSPRLSIEAITSLSLSEIYYNPHYHNLCMKYDHVSDILATYLGTDLAEFHISQCNKHILGTLPGAGAGM